MKTDAVSFSLNSAIISVDNDTILNKISKTLLECPTYTIKINGFTDSSGELQANYLLSRYRSESVMSALIARGIDPNTVSAQGFGPENPVASNNTSKGRQQNRRIEIKLTVY